MRNSEVRRCGGFRFLEHMSDVYFEATGNSIEEVFEWAAKAMFETMTDTSKVKPLKEVIIEDEGIDLMNALYRWLEDLLIEYSANNMVFSKFKVEYVRQISNDRVVFKGRAWGEEFNPEIHEPRVEVKAVTYSLMEIGKKNNCWYARVVLDI